MCHNTSCGMLTLSSPSRWIQGVRYCNVHILVLNIIYESIWTWTIWDWRNAHPSAKLLHGSLQVLWKIRRCQKIRDVFEYSDSGTGWFLSALVDMEGVKCVALEKILLATEFKLPWDVEKERLRVLFQLMLGWEVSFMIQSTIFSTYNKIRRCSVLKLKNAHIIYNVCQNDCQRVSYCDLRKIFRILFFIWILGWYTCDPRTAYVTVSYIRKHYWKIF